MVPDGVGRCVEGGAPGCDDDPADGRPGSVGHLGQESLDGIGRSFGVRLGEEPRISGSDEIVEPHQENIAGVGCRHRGGTLHPVENALLDIVPDGGVEADLAAEVVVERADRHVGAAGELGHADGGEAARAELCQRLVDETGPRRTGDGYPAPHGATIVRPGYDIT